ncbi:MAG: TolC family protein, partial [Chitinophagia bacterium]|nr:TolC family protein [Chitinophagia bacterium]
QPFNIAVPEVKAGDQLATTSVTPEEVYTHALTRFGSIKGAHLRVEAAEKSLSIARGALYPQLSASYQAGSNFASNAQTYSYKLGADQPTGAYAVDSLQNRYYIYQPGIVTYSTNTPLNVQLENNLRHTVMLSLNIPVFNSWQVRYNIAQSRISLESQRLSEYSARLTLRQNVYKAHNNALNSIQKYYAASRAEQAATRALDFAKRRYDLGLTSTVDFLVTQNAQFTAATNLAIAKYDLLFKLKVIDYYLGKELKL